MKKFVKIASDRGWTPGLYEVVDTRKHGISTTLSLRLAGTRDPAKDLYLAHTYVDADCTRASKQHADQIGRKK
jgi:hypothetical protein